MKRKNVKRSALKPGAGTRPQSQNRPAVDDSKIPSLLEYDTGAERWRVGEFTAFNKALAVLPSMMENFHQWISGRPDLERGWFVLRRLYSINPVAVRQDANPDLIEEELSMDEIAKRLETDVAGVDAEVDLVIVAWVQFYRTLPQQSAPAMTAIVDKVESPREAGSDERADECEQIIKSRGFTMAIFRTEGRSKQEEEFEIAWFASRLMELKRIFDEPMVKEIGRRAIINELHMMRIDFKMAVLPCDTQIYASLLEMRQSIEKTYLPQLNQIEEICPYAKAVANKVTVTGAMSDITIGYWKALNEEDNSVVDGLFTAFGWEVEQRQSIQAPTRYRPGWNAAVLEARAGLWDPKFRRTITNQQCAILDTAYAAATVAINEKFGTKLPNLLLEGDGGEYRDVVRALELPKEDVVDESGMADSYTATPEEEVPLDDIPKPEDKK